MLGLTPPPPPLPHSQLRDVLAQTVPFAQTIVNQNKNPTFYLNLDGNVYLLVSTVYSSPLLLRRSWPQMRQVATDTVDMHCVVVAPSFFSPYKHAMIALLLLARGAVDDPLSHGWKICTNLPIELNKLKILINRFDQQTFHIRIIN